MIEALVAQSDPDSERQKQKRMIQLVEMYFGDDRIMLEAAQKSSKREAADVQQLLAEHSRLKESRHIRRIWENKHAFFKSHLAQLFEPRTPPFLALDTLSNWDPHGNVYQWTNAFKTDARPLPEHIRPAFSSEFRLELQFLRYIASLCAEYSGLWAIRNTLQDLALIGLDADKVEAIVQQCNKPEIHEQTADKANLIKKHLTNKRIERDVNVYWEWRHVASIDIKLGDADIELRNCRYHVWRLGYVKVECESIDECYRLLGHLHAERDVQCLHKYFRDFMGEPEPAGYKAIHTTVDIDNDKFRNRIQVRFIVKQIESSPLWKLALESALSKRKDHKPNTIRVFTPRNDFRDLPNGACVLDFVYRLYQGFVGKVEFAIVDNIHRVDLLSPLRDQAEVQLVLNAKGFIRLPEGWEQKVKTHRKRIRHALRNNMSPQLEAKGRARIASLIPALTDLPGEVVDQILEMSIEEANENIFRTEPAYKTDFTWWLRELGVKDLEEYEPDQCPFHSFIDNFKETTLIKHIHNWLELASFIPGQDIIDKDLRKGKASISLCPECSPDHQCERVIKPENNILVFHRKGYPCAEGGTEIKTESRAAIGQYFLFEINGEINGETGTLSRILDTLHKMDVRTMEVISKYLSMDWAVIRIEVGLLTRKKLNKAMDTLRRIDDIEHIYGPQDPVKPILEETLPARNAHANNGFYKPPPYILGGVVQDDQSFYNRSDSLGILLETYELQSRNRFSASRAFICGPLKTGKTSLAYKFERTIKSRDNNIFPVSVYYQAQSHDKWSDVEKELTSRLREQLLEMVRSGHKLAKPLNLTTSSLSDMLSNGTRLQSGKPVVIVLIIDEVLIPFRQAHEANEDDDSTELDNIRQFSGMTHNRFGSFIVWIGPRAPVSSLNIDLQNILRAGEQIRLKPFNKQHTGELLMVSQAWWKYRITINNHIINYLWRLTGGNPFWLNHLGRQMWEQASLRPSVSGKVQFTMEDVHLATNEVLANDILFADRFNPEGYYRLDNMPEDYKLILSLLLDKKAEKNQHWTDTWITRHDIIEQFKLRDKPVDQQQLASILEDMVAMGGIISNNDKIRISSPLLGEWIALHNDFFRS